LNEQLIWILYEKSYLGTGTTTCFIAYR